MRGKARPLFCSRQKQLCFQLHFVLSSCSAISNNTSSVISREKAKKRKEKGSFPLFFFCSLSTKLRKKTAEKLRSDSAVNVLICVVFSPLAGVLIDRSHVNRIILWRCFCFSLYHLLLVLLNKELKFYKMKNGALLSRIRIKNDGNSIITPGVQKWRVFTAAAIYILLAFFFKYRRKNSLILHTNSKEAKYCI